jgi:TP53 regulating kinase-like protein
MAKLLNKGAEASISIGDWFGKKVIFKKRDKKNYRHPNIDLKIRELRTIHEASMLVEAKKLGVTTPLVYFVDRDNSEIVMQYIPGRSLKDFMYSYEKSGLDSRFRDAGRMIAYLHKGYIIHGDLTTSNFIINNEGLVLVDFGLSFFSQRLEDKAVDLHLLYNIVKSAHNQYASRIKKAIDEGYRDILSNDLVRKIMVRVKKIEMRGRYKRVE